MKRQVLKLVTCFTVLISTPALADHYGRGDEWAAIAVGDEEGSFGAAAKQKTKAAARRAAVQSCKSKGFSSCEAVAVSKGSCLALAESAQTGGESIGWSENERSKQDASKIANAECVAENRGDSCKVLVSFCSDNK